jgi:hypothetical protein
VELRAEGAPEGDVRVQDVRDRGEIGNVPDLLVEATHLDPRIHATQSV